jgi:hypothetical protein
MPEDRNSGRVFDGIEEQIEDRVQRESKVIVNV